MACAVSRHEDEHGATPHPIPNTQQPTPSWQQHQQGPRILALRAPRGASPHSPHGELHANVLTAVRGDSAAPCTATQFDYVSPGCTPRALGSLCLALVQVEVLSMVLSPGGGGGRATRSLG
ncbi:hypothetical protein OAO87_04825, partial [bacterium]|nr:hypothetical protein [bacterium]